ncbi:MAG: hypothetical protein GXP35_08975 [Actinobacteria bacterium]|nr:hypothetical protein [Actinomycetota bacterium]
MGDAVLLVRRAAGFLRAGDRVVGELLGARARLADERLRVWLADFFFVVRRCAVEG